MKKHLTVLTFLILAMSAKAQDIFSVGHYNVTNGTIAALYKNDERLYTAHITGMPSKAFKVACNSEGDVFWLVNHYKNNSLNRVEIRKNDQVYASMENVDVIHINDMYCHHDTIYYAGYQLNESGVATATVWKGEDFSTHWVLGDGIHASVIYDADVDKSTNIPYFCGYVTDSIQKAAVWKERDLFYSYQGQHPYGWNMQYSYAIEISIDNGQVYTLGYGDDWTFIWEDNSIVYEFDDLEIVNCLYTHQGDSYYTYCYPHGMYYAVYKNRGQILELPLNNQTGVQRICGDLNDIYMVGKSSGQGCIWKNFEVYLQPNDCSYLYDMVVSYANVGIDEPDEGAFKVYPNPTNDVLFVETHGRASLPDQNEYRVTNMMGQTLLQGTITDETKQINIGNLPAGLYFISMGGQTVKFVVR